MILTNACQKKLQRLLTRVFVVLFLVSNSSFLHGQNATNPILYTDVPDPDFVRVGDTYYMSSTTMYFNPGLPIMKSKDLVNWELVNYCYPIMASNDGLNLNNGKEAYSGGTWASSINYHQGRFYVSSFSYSTGKTYIYHTASIENGPWTTITLNKVYHDHSILFDDDGKVYIAYGHDDIQLTELKPDLTGEQPGGVNKVIINKASSVAGSNFILTAEGTRIQKINGMYYVSNICWPSGRGRTQILHRSSSITGTYEGRVVFQSSNGSAQGEYIDTPDGKWYAMFFHDHGALGRIPDLMPVTWNGGWPTVGVNGQVPATLDIPKGDGTLKGLVVSDEFSSAPPLKLQWQWNHNPNNNFWSLTDRPGFLRLTNERTDGNVLQTTNTLTQRTFGPKSTGFVALDVSGMKNGDYAGMVALQNNYGFIGVKMSGGNKTIVRAQGKGFSANSTELASVPLNQNTVYLRLDFDFTNRVDDVYFYYSLDGNTWQAFGSKTDINFDLEHFTGYRFGLFSYATQSSGGYVDFDFFRVGPNINSLYTSGPSISFTSPTVGQSLTEGQDIVLSATASSPNGTITNVKFYNGSTLLSTDNSAPYSYTWINVAKGNYALKAVVTDNTGKTAETTISIKVNIPQAPYQGKTHIIPGTIQLEEFDVGGNGSAYMDDTPGSETGVTFRSDEDVDIENCTDAGAGYNIGWTSAGEWLEYTTEVTKAGKYDLQLRVACNGADRTVSVSMDGEAIVSNIAIPNTAGWQTWQTVTVPNIELMPGKKVMRLTIGATDFVNLNYVTFVLKEEYVKEPFNGTAHLIPGRIEAEEYDKGGEGLGYHEANANGNQGSATLRNDEVDIEATQDVDGEYNIGYTLTGEWLEYIVNVTKTEIYDLDIRVAKDGTGGLFHIEMDGVDITGPISVPNTGGWQVWETVTLNDISLTAGEHVMRIEFDTDYTNLNYVEFRGLVTGLSYESLNEVYIYPNPTSGVLSIENVNETAFTLSIVDLSGKLIMTQEIHGNEIEISDLPKGSYLFKIITEDQIVIKPVVKF